MSDRYDSCLLSCKPCEGCGQHIPKTRTYCELCAPDATAGDGPMALRYELWTSIRSSSWTHGITMLDSDVAAFCDHILALPALHDVLAAAARGAEKVRRVEEIRDALADTIAEADAEAPGVRQTISPTVLLTWLDSALDVP